MLEDIKEKVQEAVGEIDMDSVKEKVQTAIQSIDLEPVKELKDKAVTAVKYLDVGNLVSEGKNLVEKIDKDYIKTKVNDFRDNAKYDGVKSLGRSAADFLGNYPRYYIEGLVGTVQDLIESKKN